MVPCPDRMLALHQPILLVLAFLPLISHVYQGEVSWFRAVLI